MAASGFAAGAGLLFRETNALPWWRAIQARLLKDLGSGKAGMLFANFGEEALADRMGDACARAVITRRNLPRSVQRALPRLPDLSRIVVLDISDHKSDTVLSYPRLMREASADFSPVGRSVRFSLGKVATQVPRFGDIPSGSLTLRPHVHKLVQNGD